VKVTPEIKVHLDALETATDFHVKNPTAFVTALQGLLRSIQEADDEPEEVDEVGTEKPSLAVLLAGGKK
jgi:hypothetical protein